MGEGSEGRKVFGAWVEVPPWLKYAAATIGGVAVVLSWIDAKYVTRIEYQTHAVQQAVDFERLVRVQQTYAAKEGDTSDRLGYLTADVAEIKTDVGWLRAYLDVSRPAPRRNGRKETP